MKTTKLSQVIALLAKHLTLGPPITWLTHIFLFPVDVYVSNQSFIFILLPQEKSQAYCKVLANVSPHRAA